MNNNKGVYRNKEGGVEECREYFKNLQEPHLFQEVSEIQKILGNYPGIEMLSNENAVFSDKIHTDTYRVRSSTS